MFQFLIKIVGLLSLPGHYAAVVMIIVISEILDRK